MKRLAIPQYQFGSIYNFCVSGVQDPSLKGILQNVALDIVQGEQDYNQKALVNNLYLIPTATHVGGTVDSEKMTTLYKEQLVNKRGTCRNIYTSLLLLAPGSVCPYCLVGTVANLDHVLPKKPFPSFALTPMNLVPACRDCNTMKGRKVARTQQEQVFHPYFDELPADKWLFATVQRSIPLSIDFQASPPSGWSAIHRNIVLAHFLRFRLQRMYSIQASTELGNLRASLVSIFDKKGKDGVVSFLELQANSRRNANPNSWQTALYECLLGDDWFCAGGFSNIAAPA